MVLIKQGVMGSYSRPIAWALGKIHKLCQKHGLDVLITSIGEGTHIPPSLHYLEPSDAIDWRPIFVVNGRNATVARVNPEFAVELKSTIPDPRMVGVIRIKEALSKGRFANQFDVVGGYDDGHFHVEYDPKEE